MYLHIYKTLHCPQNTWVRKYSGECAKAGGPWPVVIFLLLLMAMVMVWCWTVATVAVNNVIVQCSAGIFLTLSTLKYQFLYTCLFILFFSSLSSLPLSVSPDWSFSPRFTIHKAYNFFSDVYAVCHLFESKLVNMCSFPLDTVCVSSSPHGFISFWVRVWVKRLHKLIDLNSCANFVYIYFCVCGL